jgi:hypothetical protein
VTLTIDKLTTYCRIPRSVEGSRALVDEVAQGKLLYEIGAQLGPSLDRVPAVVRLKRLSVSLQLSPREIRRGKLACAWARALGVSLHRALARPAADGVISSRLYETRAAYKAAMVHHVLSQGTARCWEFPELRDRRDAGATAAALSILLEEPDLIGAIVASLEEHGWLDSLLVSLDDWALERIFAALSCNHNGNEVPTLAGVLEVARAARAAEGLQRRWSIAGRHQAMRLWVRMNQLLPVRAVWESLRLLVALLENPGLLSIGGVASRIDGLSLPQWGEAVLDEIRRAQVRGGAPEAARSEVRDLFGVLEDLRPQAPTSASPTRDTRDAARWISSDRAGILLMLPIVRGLNLWRLVHTPELIRFGGPRALSFLLAGVGMTLFEGWRVGDSIDPAVALFAGIVAEHDRSGMKQFFAEADVSALSEFTQARTWPDALENLATELARSFASRIRGFQRASRRSVAKQFLQIPGRVRVEETGLLVLLESTPWAVALHLSGMDATLGRVEWIGDRRVEFSLQGL